PWRPLSGSAYRASVPRPPYEAEYSPARAPSAASPDHPSTLRTQIASDSKLSLSLPIHGRRLRPFVPEPATHPPGAASRQSLQPNASSAASYPSLTSTMPSLLLAPSEGGRSCSAACWRFWF